MVILFSILFFVFGLIIGSFLNVVIFRLKTKESIIKKRSHCLKCKKQLKVLDLFPVLSFLFLKGKCRYCKKPISIQYPLVELGTALIFLIYYFWFDFGLLSIYFSVITCFLIIIFVFDLRHYLIPDRIILPALLIALAGSYFVLEISLLKMLMGVLVGGGFFLLLFLVSKGKAMGMGDVKLGVLGGLIVGFPQVILVLFFAFIFGGIIGGVLLLMGKKKRKDILPFAPFFVTAIIVTLLFGEWIINRWWM